jgi:hypothetical protein
MRINDDLQRMLNELLERNFADMPLMNRIEIAFGRRAKRRFGSIKLGRNKKVSFITINGLFKQEIIPEEIIRATIAHELCHYAHGFSSPLPRKYKHPHQGGVIERELRKRDLQMLYDFEKKWTKSHWTEVLKKEFPMQKRAHRAVRRRRRPKSFLERLINSF